MPFDQLRGLGLQAGFAVNERGGYFAETVGARKLCLYGSREAVDFVFHVVCCV